MQLKSITFKEINSRLSSVQCVLSNGEMSPLFEKQGEIHENPMTISLDLSKPVREVAAFEHQGSEYGEISRVTLLDGSGHELHSYCP